MQWTYFAPRYALRKYEFPKQTNTCDTKMNIDRFQISGWETVSNRISHIAFKSIGR